MLPFNSWAEETLETFDLKESININEDKKEVKEKEPEDILVEKTDQPIFPPVADEITNKERAINFGVVYAAQWTHYLIDQHEIINKTGSFENWTQNPFKPHFDKDNFEFNIYKHSLAGTSYYLWYRSRGYEVEDAFIWAFISSLAFEFTIETITEPPSYQDIYQTPVFGTVVGIGLERANLYFHSFDNWFAKSIGYLLNPFTLIPRMKKENQVSIYPYFNNKEQGVQVSLRF